MASERLALISVPQTRHSRPAGVKVFPLDWAEGFDTLLNLDERKFLTFLLAGGAVPVDMLQASPSARLRYGGGPASGTGRIQRPTQFNHGCQENSGSEQIGQSWSSHT